MKAANDNLTITFGGYSSQGAKDENQDAFALKISQGNDLALKGHLAVIADGVSSANCAAKASQMSVCHFIEEYMATPATWSVQKSAATVLSSLNNWLYSRQLVNTESGELEQWLSTFSALVLRDDRAFVFHVGDCQIVKINADGYQILTKEHATPSGILNRALGASEHIEVDVCSTPLDIGDILMLSCDGVYQHMSKQQISMIITRQDNLELAAQEIATLAATQGSLDNLTCLLLKIEQLPKQAFNQLLFNRKQQVIPPPLPVGAKIDNFKIIEILEQSTRSHIYLAKDLQQDKLMVLKMPSLNFTDDQAYLDAFIKEGWIGDTLNHPAVMKISAQQPPSKFIYHVCQHVQGQTLAQWINDNASPSLSDVRDIAGQLITTLRALQRSDVTHGDIKPDNFMIDGHGRIMLIDLGSCSVGALATSTSALPLGTLTYSAPELFYGASANTQSDLFSLAVVIYQMLCQHLPYKEISHVDNAPSGYNLWRYRPLNTYRKDLPDWLDMVLAKALSADPSNRYQHYSEFISELSTNHTPARQQPQQRPLLERDPVRFWQSVSFGLFFMLLISLFIG